MDNMKRSANNTFNSGRLRRRRVFCLCARYIQRRLLFTPSKTKAVSIRRVPIASQVRHTRRSCMSVAPFVSIDLNGIDPNSPQSSHGAGVGVQRPRLTVQIG